MDPDEKCSRETILNHQAESINGDINNEEHRVTFSDQLADQEEDIIVPNIHNLKDAPTTEISSGSETLENVNEIYTENGYHSSQSLDNNQEFLTDDRLINNSEILVPTTGEQSDNLSDIVSNDHNQEVIAISDDEDDMETGSSYSTQSPQKPFSSPRLQMPPPSFPAMNFTPMPSSLTSMPMTMHPPPLRPMFPPRYSSGPNDVITLSDDDDDQPCNSAAAVVNKHKRSSRKRSTMFNPIRCPFCFKPKRETICMSKHMINRHWARIRSHNMGNSKATDYTNIKDDREIPVEKYKDDRYYQHRSRSPPVMSHYPPPPSLSGPGSSHSSVMSGRSSLVEQPLRPSFPSHARSAFGRAPGAMFGPSPSSGHHTVVTGPREESKSLGEEVAEELGHPSNRKLVQSQLSLLMHANKCESRGTLRKQNSFFDDDKTCSLPHCAQTKDLLRHLPSCQAETDCPVPKCFMSKQIVKWALSPDSPEQLRDMRSELNRQANKGLPREVVEWATKNKFEKKQWKHWRESQGSNDKPKPIERQVDDSPVTLSSLLSSSTAVNKDHEVENSTNNSTTSDWKMKYQLAREKLKSNQKSVKLKNGSSGGGVNIGEKVDQSPASGSADILSSLLSAQTESAVLRRVRKKDDQNQGSRNKVPKLIPAPETLASSGEEAAQFNSMLSL